MASITTTPPLVAAPTTARLPQNARIAAAKPRITIQIPGPGQHQTMPVTSATLRTPATTIDTATASTPYVNPFSSMMYPTSGFVFKQFEGLKDFTFASAKSGLNIGEKSAFYIYEKFSKWSRQWFTHCFLFLVILLYSVAGAFMFVALEGPKQQQGIVFVRELKHNFSETLHHLAQDERLRSNLAEWQGAVDRELLSFVGDLSAAIKAGHFDEDQKAKPPTWTFWNAMFYCGTIYTTIGYGHICPTTNAGRALTIAYAIIGIPMFLILLADFGKLFTRGIKVLWRYVRRLYYTGSMRRVRKQAQVQEVLRGMNIAYEVATFRRPSMMMRAAEPAADAELGGGGGDGEGGAAADAAKTSPHLLAMPSGGTAGDESPITPAPTEIDIDDEFNLPISLAIFLLLAYILCGAAVYSLWEDWTFFEASYFVFISMSTIGFGDYVPKHPMFMMASILYLVFGLALTSMCINVVQVKLSDSFRQASAKISASIGIVMAEQEAEAQSLALEEEARKSQGTTTPADGAAGLDVPQVHHRSAVAPPKVVVEESKGDSNVAAASNTDVPPPALPPKKATPTTTSLQNAVLPSPDEVKKRRRFWK